jgi:tetratricopeptide (TPR) repeat protein
LSLLLAVLVVGVYAPVRHYDFVSFDDPSYVSENPHVASGFNSADVHWAFGTTPAGYWIPLTWLSYMLTAQLGGATPGAQHVTNVLLHLLNTVLLFGVLRRLTGAIGRSLFVAALFAVHPLHVESVAWVTERKDVLSTFFFLLAILSYARYSLAPSAVRYLCVATAFVCGLMAKPMVVTLPLVLLLLDVWPLKRLSVAGTWKSWLPLVREKLPLFVVGLAFGAVTFLAQRTGGGVVGLERVSSATRVTAALTGYVTYIFRTVWPASLSVFYPYPLTPAFGTAAVGLVVLALVSVLAVKSLNRYPFLAVGWFWYVITLLPVIGFLQTGMQATADRFTYIPLIGLFVIVAWSFSGFVRLGRRTVMVLATCFVLVLAGVARGQVETWRNDSTLWQHALAVTPDNFLAHDFLGRTLDKQGRTEAAAWHFAEAVRLNPAFADGHQNLARMLAASGRLDEAIGEYRQALAIEPTGEELTGLAVTLARRGDTEEALTRASEAVALVPRLAVARYNLALMLLRAGRARESIAQFAEACRLRSDFKEAHAGLAAALADIGETNQAIAEYRAALRLDETLADAHHGLAAALTQLGNRDEALREYTRAATLEPNRSEFQDDLGFALAARGDAVGATSRFAEAVRLAPNLERAHYHLGLVLAATGRFREATEQFEEALRLDPADQGARRALAAVPRR